MINRNNVVDYISFLYQKKFNQPAPQDLLDSWSGLNDNETAIHLNGLYRHWNLDAISAKNFEQEFFNKSNPRSQPPIMPSAPPQYQQQAPNSYIAQQQYYQEPPKKKGGKTALIVIVALLVLAGLAYYVWDLSEQSTDVPSEVAATDAVNATTENSPLATTAVAVAPPQSEDDQINFEAIRNLLMAEERRNFEEIYSFFDPNMERYWDINYPIYDELKARYQHTWDITEDNKHTNVKIEKVTTNTYDLSETYSYFSLKDEKQKTVNSKVRFVFNDDHKIIKTYGI